MAKFEVIYEFNGKKIWSEVFADNVEDAKEKIIEDNNGNVIIFLHVDASLEEVARDTKKPDLSAYTNPSFKLSDESYKLWVDNLAGKNNE